MNKRVMLVVCMLFLGFLLTSCDQLLSSLSSQEDLEGTRVALAIQQTSMAIEQARLAQEEPVVQVTEHPVEPPSRPIPPKRSRWWSSLPRYRSRPLRLLSRQNLNPSRHLSSG
jgi:hypothetical protein